MLQLFVMKLVKVKIQNYRSVNSTEFPIDKNLTTLVGANEHGKTNLLRAIELLNFETAIKISDGRTAKNSISEKVGDTKVFYEFSLSDLDYNLVNKNLLDLFLKIKNATVAATPVPTPTITPTGENTAIITNQPLSSEVVLIPKIEIRPAIKISKNILLEISYKDELTNYYKILEPINLNDDEDTIILDFIKTNFKNNIFYFDTFDDRLNHRINKNEIIEKNNDVTNGLIKLAGLSGQESKIFEDTQTARQLIKNGAEELTRQLKSLWIQGKEDDIQVNLGRSLDGTCLNVDIEDFNTYGDISTRSRGFLFFLSFILKFKQYHDGDLKNFIFLIDEPGIFLHPRGQKDLLLYLENLSKYNQMIYTTHSPFMINRLDNFRVRVVSKDKEKGTQVDVKPYMHNWKSLRASLGMMLADSFYYADNNLVVEGSSDRLYLLTLLKTFHEKSIIKSELNILSIIDSSGASNVASMCKIVKSEDRPYVAFVDSDKSGKSAKTSVEKLTEKTFIKEVSDFNSEAVTIEDLLPRKYLNLAINLYITELSIEGVCSKPTVSFDSKAKGNVIEELNKYISDNNLGIEDISKLNIARHFDEEISKIKNEDFNPKDFDNCKALITWITQVLNI